MSIERVNGDEPSGVVATRDELELVAKYWLREILDYHWLCFAYHNWGHEGCDAAYGAQRLQVIGAALGSARVIELDDEVHEEFQNSVDSETWRIFTVGTQEERAEYHRQQDAREEEEHNRRSAFDVVVRGPNQLQERSQLLSSLWLRLQPGDSTNQRCFARGAETRAEAEAVAEMMADLQIPGLTVEILPREGFQDVDG